MRKILLGILSCVATILSIPMAQAADPKEVAAVLAQQPGCNNFVQFDSSNLFLGSGQYKRGVEEPRSPIPGTLRVAALNRTSAFDLQTLDAPLNVVTESNAAFVLTYSGIEEWNVAEKSRVAVHRTYYNSQPMRYKQHALGMDRFQNKLIIAHGRLGLSFFDLKNRRITKQVPLLTEQLPLESMAVDVSVVGDLAYVLVDSFSLTAPNEKPAFRGVIIVDMKSESIVAQFDGMTPGADHLVADAKSLIVSFIGMPVLKYDISGLTSNAKGLMPEPSQEIVKFSMPGHPVGRSAIDKENIYTCFIKPPASPGADGGFYKRSTATLNRKVLVLD